MDDPSDAVSRRVPHSDEGTIEPAAESAPAAGPAGRRRQSLLRRFLWPSWDRRKSMLRAEAWAVVLGAYALLAFAYLWPQDYRNTAPAYVAASWAAFLARVLQFHLGLLLLVIALAAAFGRGRRLFLAATPLVLFTLVPPYWHLVRRPAPPPAAAGPSLRVMSVNLLMVNEDYGPVAEEIRAAKPDVLLLQEYTDGWHAALQAALAAEYPHVRFRTQDDSFGTAVYSRLPFADDERGHHLRLGSNSVPQTRLVVRFGGREVALYNLHLLPPRRLDYTTESRLQFADLLDHLAAEELPAVVAGDFNLTETTPQHAALRRAGLADAWDVAGQHVLPLPAGAAAGPPVPVGGTHLHPRGDGHGPGVGPPAGSRGRGVPGGWVVASTGDVPRPVPSPGTPGEGQGEGSSVWVVVQASSLHSPKDAGGMPAPQTENATDPHPRPLPEYRERE